MDQLAKRYADPCFVLNGVIGTGRLSEFVDEFLQITETEKEDQANWDFFLHKVFEGSFNDFMEEQKNNKQNQNMSARTIETTIQHTNEILNNFNPEERGEK
jgi:hypothetical protein